MSRRRRLDAAAVSDEILDARRGGEMREAAFAASVAEIRQETAESARVTHGGRNLDSLLDTSLGCALADRRSMERTIIDNVKCRGVVAKMEASLNVILQTNSCRFQRGSKDFSENLARDFAGLALERMRCLLMLENYVGAFSFAREEEMHTLIYELFNDPSFGNQLRLLVARSHVELGERIFQTHPGDPNCKNLAEQARQIVKCMGIVPEYKVGEIDDYHPAKLARIILRDGAGLAKELMGKGDADFKRKAWITRAEAVIAGSDCTEQACEGLKELWSSFHFPVKDDRQWLFLEAPLLGLMKVLAHRMGFGFPVDDRIGPRRIMESHNTILAELWAVMEHQGVPANYKTILEEKLAMVNELSGQRGIFTE